MRSALAPVEVTDQRAANPPSTATHVSADISALELGTSRFTPICRRFNSAPALARFTLSIAAASGAARVIGVAGASAGSLSASMRSAFGDAGGTAEGRDCAAAGNATASSAANAMAAWRSLETIFKESTCSNDNLIFPGRAAGA
jgi:hypothetical protein